MRYRTLGKTGLKVSEIGFGGIPIQRVEAHEVNPILEKCRDMGITFIDTGRGYSVSEERIGRYLKESGSRQEWTLATKSMDRDYAGMKKSIETSLMLLETDRIDLYQCHFVKTREQYDAIMGEDGAYQALAEAKAAGLIGHIGITSHNADLMMEVIGEGHFETLQFPLNIIEFQGLKLYEKAHALGMGTIVMKPMAGGSIDRGDIALKYVLNNPHVSVAIPGMDTVEQVSINGAAGSNDLAYTEEDEAYMKATIEKFGNHFCRRCGYCAPCSVGIDIPLAFTLNGYLTRYDLGEWAYQRYESITPPEACIHCGACEPRCPYDLPIQDMLKDVGRNFEAFLKNRHK
jgi:predicted aldo/keto reductase-like oxidoreductase